MGPLSEGPSAEERADTAKLKAILIVCAALAFAVAPFMSDPFTGWEADAFPHPTPPLPLQPAGYAFAIWGVIYAWLVVHGFYGLIKRDTHPDWDAGRWPLFISLALGTGWLGVALTSPVMATIFIFAMLAGALLAMLRVPVDQDIWLARMPLGLYAGWLTAASFVAGSTVLAGWTGLPPLVASFLGLAGVAALGGAVASRKPPLSYHAALTWALVGVAVASAGMDTSNVVFTGAVLAAAIAVAFLGVRQAMADR